MGHARNSNESERASERGNVVSHILSTDQGSRITSTLACIAAIDTCTRHPCASTVAQGGVVRQPRTYLSLRLIIRYLGVHPSRGPPSSVIVPRPILVMPLGARPVIEGAEGVRMTSWARSSPHCRPFRRRAASPSAVWEDRSAEALANLRCRAPYRQAVIRLSGGMTRKSICGTAWHGGLSCGAAVPQNGVVTGAPVPLHSVSES